MVENLLHTEKVSEASVLEETKASLSALKKEVVANKINIRQKPAQLGYTEINKEKQISINLPNQFSTEGRILRCLRWKSATDAVEKKYNIPKGLLLAMMAQEGMGEPTMPNLGGDGGLGLIHIQAVNAADFGLKTLPRYTTGMRDMKHGKEITSAKKRYNDSLKDLIYVDERFHPIMGLDCSARFLKNVYTNTSAGKDKRINALRKYSGRELEDYLWPVVKYWILINQYIGDPLPDFSKNTNKEINKMKTAGSVSINGRNAPLNLINNSIKKLSITLDGKPSTYQQYTDYYSGYVANYELDSYINSTGTLGKTTQEIKKNQDIKNLRFLNVSKDKKWNIYKYTVASSGTFSTITQFLQITKLYDKFNGKNIMLTDEHGNPLSSFTQGESIYIKEKKN